MFSYHWQGYQLSEVDCYVNCDLAKQQQDPRYKLDTAGNQQSPDLIISSLNSNTNKCKNNLGEYGRSLEEWKNGKSKEYVSKTKTKSIEIVETNFNPYYE